MNRDDDSTLRAFWREVHNLEAAAKAAEQFDLCLFHGQDIYDKLRREDEPAWQDAREQFERDVEDSLIEGSQTPPVQVRTPLALDVYCRVAIVFLNWVASWQRRLNSPVVHAFPVERRAMLGTDRYDPRDLIQAIWQLMRELSERYSPPHPSLPDIRNCDDAISALDTVIGWSRTARPTADIPELAQLKALGSAYIAAVNCVEHAASLRKWADTPPTEWYDLSLGRFGPETYVEWLSDDLKAARAVGMVIHPYPAADHAIALGGGFSRHYHFAAIALANQILNAAQAAIDRDQYMKMPGLDGRDGEFHLDELTGCPIPDNVISTPAYRRIIALRYGCFRQLLKDMTPFHKEEIFAELSLERERAEDGIRAKLRAIDDELTRSADEQAEPGEPRSPAVAGRVLGPAEVAALQGTLREALKVVSKRRQYLDAQAEREANATRFIAKSLAAIKAGEQPPESNASDDEEVTGGAGPWFRHPSVLRLVDALSQGGRPLAWDGLRHALRDAKEPGKERSALESAFGIMQKLDGELSLAANEPSEPPPAKAAEPSGAPLAGGKAPRKPRQRRRTLPTERKVTVKEGEAIQIVGECNGSFANAAKRLGKNRKTVQELYENGMKKLGQSASKAAKARSLPEDKRGQAAIANERDDKRGVRGL